MTAHCQAGNVKSRVYQGRRQGCTRGLPVLPTPFSPLVSVPLLLFCHPWICAGRAEKPVEGAGRTAAVFRTARAGLPALYCLQYIAASGRLPVLSLTRGGEPAVPATVATSCTMRLTCRSLCPMLAQRANETEGHFLAASI